MFDIVEYVSRNISLPMPRVKRVQDFVPHWDGHRWRDLCQRKLRLEPVGGQRPRQDGRGRVWMLAFRAACATVAASTMPPRWL